MSTILGWGYWIIGIACTYDAARFKREEWLRADREKPFWCVMLVILWPLLILPYLMNVRPRLKLARLIPPKRKAKP
jgi:hypothetical protein